MSLMRLSVCGIFVALAIATPMRAQDVLQWETDLARAQQTAAQTNRLVLIHFWGTWCPPCMRMEHEVFGRPGLGTALSPYYVPCKIQVEQGMNEELVKQFAVDVFPSDIVMTPQGQIVHRSKGYQSAERYVGMLQQTAQTTLAQARPVAAGAPAGQPPAVTPTPAAPPSAGAPSATPTAPSAAATKPSDDRYAYYFGDRGAPSASAASQPPPPPTTPMPATSPAPAAAATPHAVNVPASAVAPQPSDDRYADYRSTAPAIPVAPAVAAPSKTIPPAATPVVSPVASAPVAPPVAAAPPAANPVAPAPASVPKIDQPPTAAVAATNAPTAEPKPPVGVGFQIPPGSPPLALDGYCPVTVTDKMVWKKGDVKFGAIHRGRTYLFASEEEQKKFLADPDSYSPVMSGNDPVVALEKGENVSGKREFGLMCEKRMFLFSSKDSYEKFCSDSKRYAGQTFQAMQAGDGVMRR